MKVNVRFFKNVIVYNIFVFKNVVVIVLMMTRRFDEKIYDFFSIVN